MKRMKTLFITIRKIFLKHILSLLIFTFPFCKTKAQCPQFIHLVQKGDSSFRTQNYLKAIHEYQVAIENCPDRAREVYRRVIRMFNWLEYQRKDAEETWLNWNTTDTDKQKRMVILDAEEDSLVLAFNGTGFGFVDKGGHVRIPFEMYNKVTSTEELGFTHVTAEGEAVALDRISRYDAKTKVFTQQQLKMLVLKKVFDDRHIGHPDEEDHIFTDLTEALTWDGVMHYQEEDTLSGMPMKGIGNLNQLELLCLESSRLRSLSPDIGELKQLQRLSLEDNLLESLPSEIGLLSALRHLRLGNNPLRRLPAEIGNLAALKVLRASFDRLDALPPEIGKLTALQVLDLEENFIFILPQEFGNLSALTHLNLNGNKMDYLEAEICKLTSLKVLLLEKNNLFSITHEIGNLVALEELDLMGNRFDSLPRTIGNLVALKRLNLSVNLLAALPPEIGNLSTLQDLDLATNQLTSLPPEIGRLSNLHLLNLDDNQLTALPPEMRQLKSLKLLFLGHNPLCDTPEKQVALMRQLKEWLPNCKVFLD